MSDLAVKAGKYGVNADIVPLIEEIQALYCADDVPWVVGYSGGKDSTAILQLIWIALEGLSPEARRKPVYVISTDTLVENPIVAAWVNRSLQTMRKAADSRGLRVEPHRLTPDLADSFWVNLIGRGYPAPRHKFRWCTERLKIKPSNKFIYQVVQDYGECLLVLGTRMAESAKRKGVMMQLDEKKKKYVRPDRVRRSESILSAHIYTPIEDWTNDEVWAFLLDTPNPWGYDNGELFTLYRGATEGGECPLVVDTSTPSCGDSRFGCWVCTLVEKDKSMSAMIQNDVDKEWMLPLLEFRNKLDIPDDRHLRDFRRMAGHVQLYFDRPIPGPYTQQSREGWLRELLSVQQGIADTGPEHMRGLELITEAELQEIRRIWVIDKHEIEDSLPRIYLETTRRPYPGGPLNEDQIFGRDEMMLLRESTQGDDLHFELVRELLDVEARYRSASRRAGLFDALELAFDRGAYADIEDATARARLRRDALEAARSGDAERLTEILQSRVGSGVASSEELS